MLVVPVRGWSWSMYSNRKSPRNPGSFHTPWTPQFVLTMQNAEPHDATAEPVTNNIEDTAASAAWRDDIRSSVGAARTAGVLA